MPRIRILGSGREVGRAAISIERDGRILLLDYGTNFDDEDRPVFPAHVKPRDIDALVLTHSHLDHIGAAPSLYISIFPKVYATPVTFDVSKLLLYDMIKLNGPHLPYDEASVEDMLKTGKSVKYDEEVEGDFYTFKLVYNGHIPGSAAVWVEVDGHRILYTSDMNTITTKLMNPAKFTGVKADTVIIESTYGSTNHPPREETEQLFYESIQEVVKKGGTVLVPSFSVSRGQEIMSILAERDFEYPVWIDGMIRQVTELYLAHGEYVRDLKLLSKAAAMFKMVRGWQDRRRAFKKPGVIIASAGMLKGGPSLYYLKKMAGNEKNAVFMVSYQAEGTPGRQILLNGTYSTEEIPVRARVQWFDFSSHTDQQGILRALSSITGLERVILVHGDPENQASLKQKIEEVLDVEVLTPGNLDVIELD
ncbi:MAG: MBL fold metallo-hydrolase [Desulfurococcales archaeon]|nr:MBL fold metallo-hydrolase [Desulfurococcales archaeon]MCE4626934.1 MBL fold metallo-hydrolase [Desulfurococcales archaeon]